MFQEKGFSLIEVLVSLAIAGVLISGVYAAFLSQQSSYIVQEQVAEMQQNIRAGGAIMIQELRMAGYSGTSSVKADIHSAEIDAISFSFDLDADGNLDYFAYDLFDTSVVDGNAIGRLTDGSAAIALTESPSGSGHFEATGHQPFALNIDHLEFYYLLADGTQTTSPADPSSIRSIQISVLARVDKPDNKYVHNETYTAASGATWAPANDHYRRRFQIMTVYCRNMGL